MEPFYTLKELSKLLSKDCYFVADVLSASNAEMISGGRPADLSKWRKPIERHPDGGLCVMTGTYPFPAPEDVLVKTEALPPSWIDKLREQTSDVLTIDAETTKRNWPWGDYETKLLGILAEAVDVFWIRYDPEDKSTAPTNSQVIAWLTKRGVARRMAEVMATILRADGLPPGPRK